MPYSVGNCVPQGDRSHDEVASYQPFPFLVTEFEITEEHLSNFHNFIHFGSS